MRSRRRQGHARREFTDMDDAEKEKEIGNAFKELQRQIVRRRILTQDYRIDGRGLRDIRTLSAEVDIVPRVHGSALFQRGETQILGVTTLNMLKMEQQIDALSGPQSKRYMHNYEMPPYSTGETGRVGSPKRREIGTVRWRRRLSCRCCRTAKSSLTPSVRSPKPLVPTVPLPWVPCARPHCRCSPQACR